MTFQRITTTFLVLGLVILGTGIQSAKAQTKVALVDIGLVFKNHPTFSQNLESLKGEADQFKLETQQLQASLMQKAEALRSNYLPDSQEFRDGESRLAQESAALEVEQRNKLRSLMEREAELHYQTYMQIKNAVSVYCEQRGIQLVMRHDSTPMNAEKPATIMQKVNGKIVFHRPNNEITQDILAMVAQGAREQLR